jgi:hypothetical protein
MNRRFLSLVLITQLVMFAGCTSTPKDLTGQTLSPIPVEQVKLYPKKPDKYDIVANITLEITPDLKWDNTGQADKAFDAVRAIAASKGANGILFDIDGSKYDFQAVASYHGESFKVPVRGTKDQAIIVAQAILVTKD